MSDKHLTESEWKKFAKGKNFKDAAFLKALAAVEKAKDAHARLDAFDEIDKQADALRKAHKADKDLAAYLDDAQKASNKARKLAQAEAKAQQEAEDEGDEEDTPTLLTTKMVPLLRQVRKGEVLQAVVALAGKDTAVLVSKRSIAPARRKMLQEYLGASGGVKFAYGECLWEENAHTFALKTQAAGLAKRIRAALLNQTETRYKVRVRGEDAHDIDDDGEAPEELQDDDAATPGTAATRAGPQAPAPDEAAAFNARMAALLPKAKPVIALGDARGMQVKQQIGLAAEAVRKKAFAQAHAVLDEVETLIAAGAASEAPQAGAAAAEAAKAAKAAAKTAFNARLASLVAQVRDVIAGGGAQAAALRQKFAEAGELARKGQWPQAEDALDAVQALLAAAAKTGPADAAAAPTPQTGAAQAFQARRDAIEPRYLTALQANPADAAKMRAVFGYADDQAAAGAYAKASGALVQLEKLLDATATAVPTAGGEQGFQGIVAYRSALLGLGKALDQVNRQVANLVRAIPDQMPDEADLAEDLAADLHETGEALRDLVDDAIGTVQNESHPVTQVLKNRLDELMADVAGNPVIKHVDNNPFGVVLNIEATLVKALKDVRDALPVAQQPEPATA